MKKVLIITYYWPPSGGPGVQRCLYFVKYLREFGWEPIVYTVEDGEYPYHDNSLYKEIPDGITVLKQKAREPFSIYKKLIGLKSNEKLKPNVVAEKSKRPFFHSIATWIRGNVFIPDARMLWIKPSYKFLSEYLKTNKIDAILTSSPPHSVQLIGYRLKKKFNIPWLVDLRDPWSRIFFIRSLKMTSWAKKRNEKLEMKVLQHANQLVTVSKYCSIGFKEISGRTPVVITNGYDSIPNEIESNKSDHFVLAYGGTLSGDRNPELLWRELNILLNSDNNLRKKFKLLFIGAIDPAVYESISNQGLKDILETYPALSHEEYIKKISSATSLLLIGTKNDPGVITGKFFEYLALKKPIIAISPKNSDVELILNQTNAGFNSDYNDPIKIKEILNWLIDIYTDTKVFKPNLEEIDKYSRKNLTKQLADLLDSICNR
ncbi:MAG: glycosyl transferase family 1 [Saprospiraceae bacterium]|nr:glycosyl transferase family 1 [Saprospiraceae bacterium]